MPDIVNLRVGDLVQNSARSEMQFVGHIVGLTVNPMGEPVYRIKATTRKDWTAEFANGLGWLPVFRTVGDTFYEKEITMHPANVERLEFNKSI